MVENLSLSTFEQQDTPMMENSLSLASERQDTREVEYRYTTHPGVFIHRDGDAATVARTTQSIPKGTLICMERPLLSLEDAQTLTVVTAYKRLSDTDRRIYDGLPWNAEGKEELMDHYTAVFNRINTPKAEREPATVAAKMVAQLEFYCRQRPGTEMFDVPRTISSMRHKCNPNTAVALNSSKGSWSAYAMTDIEEGGSVNISRVDPTLPVTQRRESLLVMGDERCECDACTQRASRSNQEGDRIKLAELGRLANNLFRDGQGNDDILETLIDVYQLMLEILSVKPEFSENECQIEKQLAGAYEVRGYFELAPMVGIWLMRLLWPSSAMAEMGISLLKFTGAWNFLVLLSIKARTGDISVSRNGFGLLVVLALALQSTPS